jgi:hypothetical protein
MNLDCPELIAAYEKQSKKSSETTDSNKRSARDSIEQLETVNDSPKKIKRANDFGYERGLEIEKILGATDVYGELMFL